MEWRGREWSGVEGREGEGRAGQGRVPDCLGGLSRVGISSRSTRPWNGQPPSIVLRTPAAIRSATTTTESAASITFFGTSVTLSKTSPITHTEAFGCAHYTYGLMMEHTLTLHTGENCKLNHSDEPPITRSNM